MCSCICMEVFFISYTIFFSYYFNSWNKIWETLYNKVEFVNINVLGIMN